MRFIRSGALLIFLSCVLSHQVRGQNLVTNGSFEWYNNCPNTSTTIPYHPAYTTFPFVQDWISPAMTTPDYFNVCGSRGLSVPGNAAGYQRPHSGNAYAGLVSYSVNLNFPNDTINAWREFLTTKLSVPLVKDSSYGVRFYVSPTFSGDIFNGVNPIMVHDIGANLSNTVPNYPPPVGCSTCSGGSYLINMRYDVINPASRPLNNDSIWYEIRGFIVAKGGEQWLTIGKLARGLPSSMNGLKAGIGYIFVDDVSVLPQFTVKHLITDCDSTVIGQAPLSSSMDSGSYIWSTGDTTKTIRVMQPGKYTCIACNDIRYIIDSFTVKADTLSSFKQVEACDTNRAPVSLSSSVPGGSYLWNTGERTIKIYPGVPGYYVCKGISSCMVATDSFLVTAGTYDSLYYIQVCDSAGISKTIQASATSPYYKWSTGESTRSITVSRTGDYTCELFNGCDIIRETYRVGVSVPTPPVLRDTVICQYAVAPVIHVQDTGLTWYASSMATTGSPFQPGIQTAQPGKTTLYVSRKDRDCISGKTAIQITIKATPVAKNARDTLIRCDGFINYALPIGLPPVNTTNYAWSNGKETPYIIPEKDGLYLLTSFNECAEVVDTFIVRSEPCDACVIFPDAFTPDGNGLNDDFGAIVRCQVSHFNLRVYNRWGQQVYNSRQLTGRWTGTQNGRPAAAGVYMYMATIFQERTGKTFLLKGEVTLIR